MNTLKDILELKGLDTRLVHLSTKQIQKDLLELVGEDEQIETNDGFGNTYFIDSPYNERKADLRTKIKAYCGGSDD